MRIGRVDTRFFIEGLGYFNPAFIEFIENDLDYLKVGFRNLETNEYLLVNRNFTEFSQINDATFPDYLTFKNYILDALQIDGGTGTGGNVDTVNNELPDVNKNVRINLDSVLAQGTNFPNGFYSLEIVDGDVQLVEAKGETVGVFKNFATEIISDNYLVCNGVDVSKANYPDLFAKIGDTFGLALDPVNNFKLPDYTGRFFVGDNGTDLGTYRGVNTLFTNQLPQHTHSLAINNDAGNTTVVPNNYLSSGSVPSIMVENPLDLQIANSSSIGLTGSGNPHFHPQLVVRVGICFKSIGINETSPTSTLDQVSNAGGFSNGSTLKKGSKNNHGVGGGISQVCSLQKELEWENGVQYYFEVGQPIVHANSMFDVIPDNNYDETKEWRIGSRFTNLVTGNTYTCLDVTTGNAIWELSDDHLQYHNDTRGDVRYYTKSQSNLNYEPKNLNIQSHITDISNPHNVTKTQIGLSNVVNLDTSTTSNITDSTNKRFVTNAQLVVIGNTSGINTGDNSVNTLYNGLVTTLIITTSNNTTILTNTSSNNIVLTGTSIDQIVNLGNTTTYVVGRIYNIVSNNDEVVNIVNNSGNTILRLEPYNSVEFTLLNNSTANGIWIPKITFAPPNRGYSFRDEFNTGTTTTGMTAWSSTTTGSGAGATAAGTLFGRKSIYQLSTGTTNAGRIAFGKSQNGTIFGNGIMFCYETDILIPTLSIVGERYLLTVGYGDNIVTGDHLDGIYFEYDESVSGDFWRLKTANNGTRSTTTTLVPVVTNTWIKLRIEVNRAGNEVLFFINSQFVGNIISNIPNVAGRNTDMLYKIVKSNGNAPRTILLDFTNENTYINR